VYCLDANTGDELWTAMGPRGHATVTVKDGHVYALSDNRILYCYDAENGDLVWETEQMPKPEPHAAVTGSPVIWQDLVIVNIGGGCAIRRESGEFEWKFEGYHGLATPVLFTFKGKPAVAIFLGDQLIARDCRTGEDLWSIPWKTSPGNNACDPVFIEDDSKMFLCTRYGKGIALYEIASGDPKELWYHRDQAHVYASGSWHKGTLYAFAANFQKLDLETGEILWDKWKSPMADSALFLGDYIVLTTEQGEVVIGKATEEKFEELNRAQVHVPQVRNVPAYWQGKLYLRNQKGGLVCAKIGK
ncbi:MAG: PQQ-like beta-propeller repeat protein, partial [Verrucomicrobiales bacterium]|nr:PQQ-like beta-propeller repeat protein [Verrucomicrobiales bacterium]